MRPIHLVYIIQSYQHISIGWPDGTTIFLIVAAVAARHARRRSSPYPLASSRALLTILRGDELPLLAQYGGRSQSQLPHHCVGAVRQRSQIFNNLMCLCDGKSAGSWRRDECLSGRARVGFRKSLGIWIIQSCEN